MAMLFYQRVWEILIMRYHGMYPLEISRLANWTITIFSRITVVGKSS